MFLLLPLYGFQNSKAQCGFGRLLDWHLNWYNLSCERLKVILSCLFVYLFSVEEEVQCGYDGTEAAVGE